MARHDFDYGILSQQNHRPWPVRRGQWVMTQTWRDLLFAHWAIDKSLLAARIPRPLVLDLREGKAWLGVVPFRMTNVAPRGVPSLPGASEFPELNVRTYVRFGDKPGVYFFSLDAANALAVWLARTLFKLPYYSASMHVQVNAGAVSYQSRRLDRTSGRAELAVSYEPCGQPYVPSQRSLEYFLVERYCLYTVAGSGHVHRVDIHHPPWRLQPATAVFGINTMTDAIGIGLPPEPPLLHFAERQDTVAWLPARADK